MLTKRQVLEKYKECGFCEDIDRSNCPFSSVGKRCELGRTLEKLGAEVMLQRLEDEE